MTPLLPGLLLLLATTPALERAQKNVAELKFKQALVDLRAVEAASGLTRDEVLRFYELQARVAAALGREEDARAAFESLLQLDPSFQLKGRASPKLTGPLFEARSVVDRTGALALTVEATESRGALERLTLGLKGPLALVEAVSVRLTIDGVPSERSVPPAASIALEVKGRTAEVSVRLVGRRAWELASATHRFSAQPLEEAPVQVELPREPPLVVIAPPPPPAPPPRGRAMRTLGILGVSTGAIAGVVGAVFYVMGRSASDTFANATAMQVEGVVPLTLQRANQLDADVALGRTGSIVSWTVGAGLLGLGLFLWILDGVLGAER